jgi:hypothetical protein
VNVSPYWLNVTILERKFTWVNVALDRLTEARGAYRDGVM